MKTMHFPFFYCFIFGRKVRVESVRVQETGCVRRKMSYFFPLCISARFKSDNGRILVCVCQPVSRYASDKYHAQVGVLLLLVVMVKFLGDTAMSACTFIKAFLGQVAGVLE